jgi:c-di-GMP-binding flagellar brake protein YcgR
MVAIPPSIRIGAAATIEVQTVDGAQEYKSRIEDIESNVLHVAVPTERGQLVMIPIGQHVTLSVLTVTSANLFVEGEIMGRRMQPLPVLVIRPIRIELNQQRNFHRVRIRVEPNSLWLWTGADGDTLTVGNDGDADMWRGIGGTIVDISGGGVGLLSDIELAKDAIVRLKFRLPLTDEPLEARGRITICRPRLSGKDTKYLAGIQFEGLSRGDQDRLARVIHQYQIEERRRQRSQ